MRIILKQRVEKLGQMGDVLDVKDGYARNFLLPRGFADRATPERIAAFEAQRAQLEAHNLHLKSEAQAVADKMVGLKVALVRQAGESGHLYGSVRSVDLAEVVTEAGFTVNRHQIRIDHPIKELGVHKVRVSLHPEVDQFVTLAVAQTREEALALLADKPAPKEEAASDAVIH
ncbi:MAG: 50S ribosomal protein L9 [Alphaproteobacteria bacterium]|jgi:large subunit ribosomal protein L9